MSDKCPFVCEFKTAQGFCQVTACINPKHNGSGTYIISKEWCDKRQMERDPDYGCGRYA